MSVTESKAKKVKKTSPKASTRKADAQSDVLVAVLDSAPVSYTAWSRLFIGDLNCRLIPHTPEEIRGYADSIFSVGQIHNIVVVECDDGRLEVVCGGGRTKAIGLLVEEGKVDPDHEWISCKVVLRDAMDVVTSSRVTDSGSHTDNASASLANQLSSTFSSLKSQASQYNDAVTRSHEYSQLASYAENNSASINQNYSQEFVGYVTSKRPGEADQLLSDAASPEVRAERDRLAQAFVEDRMKPQLLQEFEQNRGRTGEGMGSVGAPSGGGNLQSEYDTQQAQMENRANAGGVRQQDDVSGDVADRRRHAESQVNSEKNTVISSGNSARTDYNRLQNEHEQGNKNFNEAKAAEEDRQKWDGGSGKGLEDLNNIKDDLQKRISKP